MVATPHGARFFVVTDRVPAATTTLLRDACVHRGVDYLDVNARNFEPSSIPLPALGDLLYRAATSPMAHLVEQYLSVAGVASFQTPAAARAAGTWQELTLARAGVPVAQSAPLSSTNRGLRKRVVESLGGLPVVVKVPGGEGGVGIMLADTWPALHSLLDHLAASGQLVHLQRFVVDAVHWRCIVVGTEVVAAYPNARSPKTFVRQPRPTPVRSFPPHRRG